MLRRMTGRRTVDALPRELADLRQLVEVQSFALRLSDSAVAVLHNVRNALDHPQPGDRPATPL